jgi:two-component system KDP operon response regulator KdpE
MKGRVLVAGSNDVRNVSVAEKLAAVGFEVTITTSVRASLRRLWGERPDLIVVDADSTDAGWDGWDLCHRVRDMCDVPLILILQDDHPAKRIHGLQIGADDVISRPFEVQEIVLRAGNVLRRVRSGATRSQLLDPNYDLLLGPGLDEIWVCGQRCRVTPVERKVLRLLVECAGRTIGHDELVESVWQEPVSAGGRARLRQVVKSLRRKIEPDPGDPQFIQTHLGLGYQFATQRWRWIGELPSEEVASDLP